jgi:hypothetical protein
VTHVYSQRESEGWRGGGGEWRERERERERERDNCTLPDDSFLGALLTV